MGVWVGEPADPPTNQQVLPHGTVVIRNSHTMNGPSSPVPYAKKSTTGMS